MTNADLHYKKMTETPVAMLILRLGIPTTISMLITSIYNMADTYFVGTLGESAQAATGVLFTLQTIIQGIAFMLGQGCGSYISRELADKNVEGASTYVSTLGMFFANFFINALIPSGSGQATAVMPIMVPLADMLGITRQTAVLAFQYGDGISNTFWFTNGTLLIYLGLAKVPLQKWYKFILPLHGLYFILEFVFLFIAVQTGYGPF